jgi:histone acetyltransferase (RNA polymerase elongator complex component)
MKKHVNIPIFIPHLGCPNQCVFCNQHTISGAKDFDPESLTEIIESALKTIDDNTEVEIAFFGGSFTGIDRELMIKLLKTAYSYVEDGRVSSIRCSTRPDYINVEVLDYLKKYGVKIIELGLQSVDEEVLSLTKRGHTFENEQEACELIVKCGFTLIGQMMIGLPGSTLDSELKTADFIIKSGASGARIYPTVVFRDTELAKMTEKKIYIPLGLDEAIKRSAVVMKKFIDSGVEVIRVGLCSSENLTSDDTYFGGPNHPAIGELVENEIYYNTIYKEIIDHGYDHNKKISVFVSQGSLSKAIGQKKKNKLRLISDFSFDDIKFCEDKKLLDYEISIRI